MAMTKISAMITVFNEDKSIGKCLNSIKGIVDEIVVVHCGPCKDKTVEIAKKYTSHIFIDKDYGVACPNRPFGFSKCTGDWVLQLDADESLSQELQQQLRKLAKQESIDAYAFRWSDVNDIMILGKKLKKYKPVFFRKSKLLNEGIVHEPTRTSGAMITSELVLNHEPLATNFDPAVYAKKVHRWVLIDAQSRVERGLAPGSRWFYLVKAPVWFIAYLLYYYLWLKYILGGRMGLQMGFFHAQYNFNLYYQIFKMKKNYT